jgi:hypothetical protein
MIDIKEENEVSCSGNSISEIFGMQIDKDAIIKGIFYKYKLFLIVTLNYKIEKKRRSCIDVEKLKNDIKSAVNSMVKDLTSFEKDLIGNLEITNEEFQK